MLKVMKRLVVSGFKPHACRLCNDCYVCHACMWERNLIRQCCFGVTEEQLDVLHEELKNKFPVLHPLMEQDEKLTSTSTESASHSKYAQIDFQNCRAKSDKRNSLECSICGKAFKTDFALIRHFNTHYKVGETFKCLICEKCFATNKDLLMHCKTHKDVESKSRVCIFCEKEFSSLSYLKIHMRRHTGERPFVCELCNNSFTTKYILNIHYKTHDIKRKAYNQPLSSELSHSTNSGLSNQQVYNINIDDCIDLDKHFIFEESDSEISDQQDFSTKLNTSFELSKPFHHNKSVQKRNQSYKAPLVIKLKSLS